MNESCVAHASMNLLKFKPDMLSTFKSHLMIIVIQKAHKVLSNAQLQLINWATGLSVLSIEYLTYYASIISFFQIAATKLTAGKLSMIQHVNQACA